VNEFPADQVPVESDDLARELCSSTREVGVGCVSVSTWDVTVMMRNLEFARARRRELVETGSKV